MTAYEDALAALLGALQPLPVETVAVADAPGRHTVADVLSTTDLPPFDNSSMDGYAVRSVDSPGPLQILGEIAAGSAPTASVVPGGCVRIYTGAPMPPGADAVVMQEDTRPDGSGGIVVLEPVKPWENVRFRGEDVRRGGRLVPAGARIDAPQMALLLAGGIDRIDVRRRARVAIASTGDELVPAGQPLGPGQVHDCNAASLAALIRGTGALAEVLPIIRDDPDAAAAALESAFEQADVVVTAGGASVGDRDVIRPAFERIGGTIRFWRIDIRPGKPFFVGERDGRYLLGLPGNPVSAFVTAVLLVLPALRRLQGATSPGPRASMALLGEPLSNPGDRRHFVRICTADDGTVRRSGIQASHILSSLSLADGLVDLPAGADYAAGAPVRVVRW
jgi:molybdopterin molybdotransferase